MIRVSSNTTLFWKMFIPTAYISFFGILALVVLFSDAENLAILNNPVVVGGYLAVYFTFIALLYFTLMSLKRVEFAEDHFIVTNYFKTYRYDYVSIEKFKTYDMLIFKLGSIHLKTKGKFGKKLRFIINRAGMEYFEQSHPGVYSELF